MDQDARRKIINDLTRRLKDLQSINDATVTRTGDYNFEEATPTIELIKQLFTRIHIEQLPELPSSQLTSINTQAIHIIDAIANIQAFDPTKHNDPNDQYLQLIQNLSKLYNNAYSKLNSPIAFIAAGHLSEARIQDQINTSLKSIEKSLDARVRSIENAGSDEIARIKEILTEAEHKAEQASDIVKSIQDAAAEAGVTKQSEFFFEEAADCRAASRVWLTATALSIIALICIALLLLLRTDLHPALQPSDLYSTIQLAVTKILIYTTLTTFVLFSIRNYNSSRHNMTVNQHRYNALRTYKALVEATDHPDTRSIVLNHAAACIFADQPTGYSKHDVTDAKIPPIVSMTPATIRATSEST